MTALVVVYLGALAWLFVRNERVYRFRQRVLDAVSVAAKADIAAGHDWRWRYDTYSSVTYGQMVTRFWRPLTVEEWYGDDALVRGGRS